MIALLLALAVYLPFGFFAVYAERRERANSYELHQYGRTWRTPA